LLKAGAGYNQMKDYGFFVLQGAPKAGQSLGEAQKILLEQIEQLKKGNFDEQLIKATVANIKLSELQAFDNNDVRAQFAMTAFIQNRGTEWDKMLSSTDAMSKVTKKEIVDFANTFFIDNYVVLNKHKGEDKSIDKVEKPAITAVKTNSNEVSPFTKSIIEMQVKAIEPKFLDYSKDLSFGKAGIADIIYVQNVENGIFGMSYRFDKGSYNYKLLPYAAQYLSYLSTDKYSTEEINRAFYGIASSYAINVGTESTTVSVTGLQENFEKAVGLLEEVLKNCKPNEQALESLKGRIIKSRENAKLNKASILNGLTMYAQFGKDNPFNYAISNQEIMDMKSSDLIALLHELTSFKHTITYYGPSTLANLSKDIARIHSLPQHFAPEAPMKQFQYSKTDSNKVYFADYDMVQAEIRWVRNSGGYNAADASTIAVFNNYFGGGMGSIVFQTIRESKALAYSTYAVYAAPNSKDKENAIIAYVGAQADKMNEAVVGMNELLNVLPESEKSFNLSKSNTLNGIETSRITKDAIIASYIADRKLGFDHDSRIDDYAGIKAIKFTDIKRFHDEKLANKKYNYCIVASEKKVNMDDLGKLGPVSRLSLEQIFGY
jgi:predicted Zn-dependent peptidase